MLIESIVFYAFAIALIGSALMVIFSRHPVRAILFLVMAFFSAAVLWMLLQAEFLSLVLIFVYVGAVMTLFLFVVMMLNIDLAPLREGFVRFLPLGIIVMAAIVSIMMLVLTPQHLGITGSAFPHHPANYSNVQELGTLLYTKYFYAFELASLILLVAIVSAISLAFFGRKPNTRTQKMAAQHEVHKADRLRIIKMNGSPKE